jgi:hypothetical protein
MNISFASISLPEHPAHQVPTADSAGGSGVEPTEKPAAEVADMDAAAARFWACSTAATRFTWCDVVRGGGEHQVQELREPCVVARTHSSARTHLPCQPRRSLGLVKSNQG